MKWRGPNEGKSKILSNPNVSDRHFLSLLTSQVNKNGLKSTQYKCYYVADFKIDFKE